MNKGKNKTAIIVKDDGEAVTIRMTGAAAQRLRAIANWRDNGLENAVFDVAPTLKTLGEDSSGDYVAYDVARVLAEKVLGDAEDNRGRKLAAELSAFIFAASKQGAA